MKQLLLLCLLISTNLFALERVNVESAVIILKPEKMMRDLSLFVGRRDMRNDDQSGASKIPAKIVIKTDRAGKKKWITRKVLVSVPLKAGVTAGFSGIMNKSIGITNYNYKKLSELYGTYYGTRIGGVLGFGGSYFWASNEHDTGLSDWDLRSGLSIDFLTGEEFIVEPMNDYSDDIILLEN